MKNLFIKIRAQIAIASGIAVSPFAASLLPPSYEAPVAQGTRGRSELRGEPVAQLKRERTSGPLARVAEIPLAQMQETYGKIPLSFEANHGQADQSINFVTRGAGYTVALSPTQALLVLRDADRGSRKEESAEGLRQVNNALAEADQPAEMSRPQSHTLRMNLVGANRAATVRGLNELEGKVNYLTGNDPAQWRPNVPTFSRVRYSEVYSGIDVVYYGNQRRLEYDFVVAPGSDAQAIALEFSGAESVELETTTGDLLVRVGGNTIRQHAPVTYQETPAGRRKVESRYAMKDGGCVGFEVGEYDKSLPLVIDPVLVYSTFVGGFRSDVAYGIAVDSEGNAYIVGETNSSNFPLANPLKEPHGLYDVFVTKINAAGTALVYSTFLGGSGDDFGRGIAIDAEGNAYVTGYTIASDYPTVNPIQATYGGDNRPDAFVTKINAAGSDIVFSTFLGGSASDIGNSIAVDPVGNIHVAGNTGSVNFPVANALQATLGGGNDAFAVKINPAGTAFVYSTFLGGSGSESGNGIAVDSAGNSYLTGTTFSNNFPRANAVQGTYAGSNYPDGGGDAFVTKINAAGSAFVYSTYLGGSGAEIGTGIGVDSAGNAHVVGRVHSTDFPTVNPIQATHGGDEFDAFVTKLDAAGTAIIYSTYLGGDGAAFSEFEHAIAVDAEGNAYISGETAADNFPLVNPIQGTLSGGDDAYVAKINAAGTALVYSTYLGGSGEDIPHAIAVDPFGNAYVAGYTASRCFPTTEGAFDTTYDAGSAEAFVFKISETGSPAPLVECPTPTPPPTPTPTPTPRPGKNFVVANINDSGPGSLRQAVLDANLAPGADTITFDNTFFSTPRTITLTSGALDIPNNTNSNVNIIGPGANLLTVSGNNNSRIFTVGSIPVIASISDMTLSEGKAGGSSAASNRGGAIYNGSELTLSGVVMTGNSAAAEGGGVYVDATRTLRVLGCTIANNTSNSDEVGDGHGGGIHGGATVADSIISGNTAKGAGSSGGGFYNAGSSTVERTTVRDNTAGGTGGGLYIRSVTSLRLTDSTVSGNMAGGDGGGIYGADNFTAKNCTVSGNRSGDQGGGVYHSASSGSDFSFVTIVENTAVNDGGGINTETTSSPLSIDNTILANNTDNGTAPDGRGSIRSDRYNLIENATGIDLTGNLTGNIIGQDPILGPLQDNGGSTQTHLPLAGSPVIDAGNPMSSSATALFDQRGVARPLDGNGDGTARADIGSVEEGTAPGQLLNISTRMEVGTGENALIGGFIITGNDPKQVIVRGIGPSLMQQGVGGALENPTLELFDGAGEPIAFNDNWRDSQQVEIEASTIPPSNDLEAAIARTLDPGNYTAVVRGNGETTGIGLVEVYDLAQAAQSKLANISSRGYVETGENVMIGGFILGGGGSRVVVRALGPSLGAAGVAGALQDPTLQLVDGNGADVQANDNWKSDQQAEIEGTGVPPSQDAESALVATLPPGNYTAIVGGVGDTTGVGLVEVYNVP